MPDSAASWLLDMGSALLGLSSSPGLIGLRGRMNETKDNDGGHDLYYLLLLS